MTNPYAPSSPNEDPDAFVASSTAGPASLLVLLLIPTLLFDAWFGVYVIAADLINAFNTIGWSLSMVREWGFLIQCAVVFSAHCLILVGAVKMLRKRTYGLAVVACALSLIPVLTPALFLGIPLGIWGLVVLRREDVRSAFTTSKT